MRRILFFLWRIVIFSFIFLGGILTGCSPNRPETELISSEAGSQEVKILFIGNSYTFVNDLPMIFAHLANEGGYNVEVSAQANGGWTLVNHTESSETLGMIRQTDWDYVILQEQSIIPSDPTVRVRDMYPAIRSLRTEIDQIDAETILFMTWGRRDGLPENGFDNFDEMQKEITTGYMEIANELDLTVAPVGTAWQRANAQYEGFDLWQSDGSHPSLTGSYLTACVFYVTIFHKSPEGSTYMANLDDKIGESLQRIAAEVILENSAQWSIK